MTSVMLMSMFVLIVIVKALLIWLLSTYSMGGDALIVGGPL